MHSLKNFFKGLVSLTDKPNTEDASIQAIAGSQYNYDNRVFFFNFFLKFFLNFYQSVHTIWSSGCHVGVIESVHGVNINGEDAENASTMVFDFVYFLDFINLQKFCPQKCCGQFFGLNNPQILSAKVFTDNFSKKNYLRTSANFLRTKFADFY